MIRVLSLHIPRLLDHNTTLSGRKSVQRFCLVNISRDSCVNGTKKYQHYLTRQNKVSFCNLNNGILAVAPQWPLASSHCYSDGGFDVPELTEATFVKYLKKKKHLFVFFYDPFCPHCRKAEPEFLRACMAASVACAKVDGPENENLCRNIGIDVFPTFRYFISNGSVIWKDYAGNKTREEFGAFMGQIAQQATRSQKDNTFMNFNQIRNYSKKPEKPPEKVIHLTSKNMKEKLQGKSVLVFFYTAGSDCKDVQKAFEDASEKLTKSVGYLATYQVSMNLSDNKSKTANVPIIKYYHNGKYVADFHEVPEVQKITQFMERMNLIVKPEVAVTTKLSPSEKVKIWRGLDGAECIVHVTSANLRTVLEKHNSLLIFFYACWSRSCIDLKNEYARAAKQLNKNLGTFAACDAEENTDIVDEFLVSRFPTFKYFRRGRYIRDYEGVQKEASFLDFMLNPSVPPKEKVRTKIKLSPSKLALTGNIPKYWHNVIGAQSLVFVTDYNYKTLLQTYSTMLIMFYVSWCKSCSVMKAEYGKAAYSLPKNAGMAITACDAEENNVVADEFLVTKLPTLKMFKNGKFVGNYVGPRKEDNILYYIKEVAQRENTFPTEVFSKEKLPQKYYKKATEMAEFWRNIDAGHKIILVDRSNFKKILKENHSILVMFYYPLLAGIELLKSELGIAAKNLHREFGIFGAYNFAENDPICEAYNITSKGLPVFKYFRNGQLENTYDGPQTSDGFLKFMKEMMNT